MNFFKKLPIVALVATFYLLLSTFNSTAQNVGINTTGATPDNSALLDLSSDDKGFLITRVDTANIASPAFGLMTLAPADSCLYMYSGAKWVSIGGVGINCNNSEETGSDFPCDGTEIPIIEVTSTTGRIWMDRNLGADQVATSSSDAAAFGDLYQWGRCSDGHEKRTSGTTATLSITDTPGHGDFITTSEQPQNWRSSLNNSLWQGVDGVNNPCPTGYRIPTEVELDAERASWPTNNVAGAFNSPLKLPAAGKRNVDGTIATGDGYYWTSTVSPPTAKNVWFFSAYGMMSSENRSSGLSVRCIKDL